MQRVEGQGSLQIGDIVDVSHVRDEGKVDGPGRGTVSFRRVEGLVILRLETGALLVEVRGVEQEIVAVRAERSPFLGDAAFPEYQALPVPLEDAADGGPFLEGNVE